MVLRKLNLLGSRGPDRMPAVPEWRDEIDDLERRLTAQPGDQWAWLWRIRHKVLLFLVADRPVRKDEPGPPTMHPDDPRRPDRSLRMLDRGSTSESSWPPPWHRTRLYGRLHDLAISNEPRYSTVDQADEIARHRICLRRTEDLLRRHLARIHAPRSGDLSPLWFLPRTARVSRVHKCLERRTAQACPRCLERLEHAPPVRCDACGYEVAEERMTYRDAVEALSARLDLPADSIERADRLCDLIERHCRAHRKRPGSSASP